MDNERVARELVRIAKSLVAELSGKTRDGKKWRETTKGFVAMSGGGAEVFVQTQGKRELVQDAKDLLNSSTFSELWKKGKKSPHPMDTSTKVIWLVKY